MSTALVTTIELPPLQDDYSFHPVLVPGNDIYERLRVSNPKKLALMMEEEAIAAKYMNTPEAQAEARASDIRAQEALRHDFATHGIWWYRLQEAHARNVSMGIVDNFTRRDAYGTLGLSPNAKPTRPIIKSAYRRLARELHPDRGGDEAAMKRLNTAYATLLAATKA